MKQTQNIISIPYHRILPHVIPWMLNNGLEEESLVSPLDSHLQLKMS